MLETFTVDYSELDGEVLFHSPINWDFPIAEIYGVVRNSDTDSDVYPTEAGGLSISIPIFIQYYDSIREILSESVEGEIHFTESAIRIFNQVFEILETDDVFRPQSTEKELQNALEIGGWNSDKRPISHFQMRNLLITTRRDNAAIFSVPGAGKTVEALAYSTIVAGPDVLFVVVCPRNAYIAWETELQASLNVPKSEIIRAIGDDDSLRGKLIARSTPPKAVLVNYNRLWLRYRAFAEYVQRMVQQGHKVVTVFDESHHFKGGKSFTSGVRRIAPFASHRILLSGTPMPKGPNDLVHQFRALLPYKMHEINAEDVTEFTQGRFVRTTKGDQGLKKPVIDIKSFPMDSLQQELHELLRDFFAAELKAGGNRKLLAEIIRLQRVMIFAVMVCSNPVLVNNKFDELLNLVDPDLALRLQKSLNSIGNYGPKFRYACDRARELASEGKKVLIWTSFVDNVALISEELSDLGAVYIRGDVPTEDGKDDPFKDYATVSDEEEETREHRINRFKTDENCMVMVANPAAAGEGISLHDVCHHAIYVDRTFHATQFMQSMDRIHRYGMDSAGDIICQKHTTTIEVLQCENSIDMMVHSNLARKMYAMYEWLNDPNLSPLLGMFEPQISDEEYEEFANS